MTEHLPKAIDALGIYLLLIVFLLWRISSGLLSVVSALDRIAKVAEAKSTPPPAVITLGEAGDAAN